MSNIFDLFKKIETVGVQKNVTHIIAGLGNPGTEYAKTRHNAGFMAIEYIAEKCGVKLDRVKFHSLMCEANIGGARVILMKPTTYMNNSGEAIAEAARFYKIASENIIVLHDEISFSPGLFRIRRKGSDGGHNGLKSIINHIGTNTFPRIKLGVGQKPNPEYDLASWVLGKFDSTEMEKLTQRFSDVASAVELIVDGKIDDAMSKYSK